MAEMRRAKTEEKARKKAMAAMRRLENSDLAGRAHKLERTDKLDEKGTTTDDNKKGGNKGKVKTDKKAKEEKKDKSPGKKKGK